MRILPIATVLLLLVSLAACATQTGQVVKEPDEGPVRIGAILHLSQNDYAQVGNAMREGIDLAVAEQNAKGGIGGRRVTVVYEDSRYNMPQAITAARKLIDVDGVSAAMISTYTEAMAAGPTFEQEGVPLVVLWDSSETIDDMGDYIFATGARTESAGTKAADYAYRELGLRRIAIINNNAEWSNAISGHFAQRFTSLGGEIVAQESSAEGEQDFRTAILKVRSESPDGIFAPLSTHADLFFRQVKQSGYDGPILSADAVTQQTIDAAGEAAEGVYHTALVQPENDAADAFRRRYIARYGKEPDMLLYNGLGYDGAKAILRAMELGDSSRDGIKEGMYRINDLEGSFGVLSFTPEGSAPRYEGVVQVRNGTQVVVLE